MKSSRTLLQLGTTVLFFLASHEVVGADLATAKTNQIVVEKQEEIDRGVNPYWALSISPAHDRFIHAKSEGCEEWSSSDCSHFLVIRDLSTGKIEKQIKIDRPVGATGWSPDGTRIAYCYERWEPAANVGILDLATGKSTYFADVSPCHGTEIVWSAPAQILFLHVDSARFFSLDLDTLVRTDLDKEANIVWEITAPEKRSLHPDAYLLATPHNHGDLLLSARDGSFSRFLYHIGDHCGFAASPDLRFVVIGGIQGGFSPSTLRILRLGVDDRKSEFGIKFEEFVRKQEGWPSFEKAVASGKPVYGDIYPAKRNPLNGMVIGADTRQLKGKVVLVDMKRVKLSYAQDRIDPGDIVSFQDVALGYFGLWATLE